ncbi:MAG: response regulator [bacterium]|nr:response regulator [bacterium]
MTTAELKQLNLRMLIVDDDPAIRNILCEICRSLGMEVHSAKDGAEGLEVFKSAPIEMAILDIYMPHMNGLSLMSRIKETNPQCQVILITGYLNYEQLLHKNKNKPDGFIPKPFSFADVLNMVLKLIDLKKNELADRSSQIRG